MVEVVEVDERLKDYLFTKYPVWVLENDLEKDELFERYTENIESYGTMIRILEEALKEIETRKSKEMNAVKEMLGLTRGD